MTTKVVKGTIWTLIGLIVPIVFSLFITPIVTRLLGVEGYGLFVLILLIPSYFNFADFGMNIASTKFGGAAFAEGSPDKEAKIIRTAALIAFLSSVPLAVAIAICAPYIYEIANVPQDRIGEASLALKIALVSFVVNFMNNIFNTPQMTRLRMDLNMLVFSGVRLAGIIATPIVIYFGGGVIGAVLVALVVAVFTLIGHLAISTRLLPELIGLSLDRASVRPLLKFGSSLVVAGVAAVLLANSEKFILSAARSVEALAYYSIAATLAAMLTLFSGSIVQSIMPAFSQLQGEADRPALNALYSRGIRLTLIWLVPAMTFMVLAGRPFFTLWFGPDFGRESTIPYYIIVGGFFFNVLAYFPYSVLMAAGRSEIFAKLYWMELLGYVVLVWWLANRFGANGAAAAWSIRICFDTGLLFMLARKVSEVSYKPRNFPQFLVAVAVMTTPLAALVYFGELTVAVAIIWFGAAAAYAVIVFARVLENDEIAWVKNRVGLYFSK